MSIGYPVTHPDYALRITDYALLITQMRNQSGRWYNGKISRALRVDNERV